MHIAAHLFTSSSLNPSDSRPNTIDTFPSGREEILAANCSGEKELIFLNFPLLLVAPTEKMESERASSRVSALLAFSQRSEAWRARVLTLFSSYTLSPTIVSFVSPIVFIALQTDPIFAPSWVSTRTISILSAHWIFLLFSIFFYFRQYCSLLLLRNIIKMEGKIWIREQRG